MTATKPVIILHELEADEFERLMWLLWHPAPPPGALEELGRLVRLRLAMLVECPVSAVRRLCGQSVGPLLQADGRPWQPTRTEENS